MALPRRETRLLLQREIETIVDLASEFGECWIMIELPEKGPRWAKDAVNAANARNKKMGSSEEFTLGDLTSLWNKCEGKCAATARRAAKFPDKGFGQLCQADRSQKHDRE